MKKLRNYSVLGLILVSACSPINTGMLEISLANQSALKKFGNALCFAGFLWLIYEVGTQKLNKLKKKNVPPFKRDPAGFIKRMVGQVLYETGTVSQDEVVDIIEEIISEKYSGNNCNVLARNAKEDSNPDNFRPLLKELVQQAITDFGLEREINEILMQQNIEYEEKIRIISHEVVIEILKEIASKHPECIFGK